MEPLTLGILGFAIVLLIIWAVRKVNDNGPPGPWGWPIIGYLPYLTSKPHLDFTKLEQKYGPVFRVQLGGLSVIILNDFPVTKEAFFQDACMGRPPNLFITNKETEETQALNGLPWKNQRRFSLRCLRDLGFGKSKLDNMLKDEINELLGHFEDSQGRPLNIRPMLAPSMSNNIASLIYGRRMKYDDPDRIMLDQIISESSANAGSNVWQFFFPWARKVVKFLRFGREDTLEYMTRRLKEFARREIAEHERTLDENNIRDYVDGYLVEAHKNIDPAFCKGVLEDMSGAFFGGGSETVRVTIEWLMLTLSVHQDVQAKVHAEIDEVLGSVQPSWDDHGRMPYTEAVIMEIMRWRNAIPLNLLRYVLWDTEINGYKIPKGSILMSNLWSVLHNPKYWGSDAEEFRPERFLEADGKTHIKTEYFIPFSVGKRSCPGEPFARSEIFLYLVCILQKFHVSLPKGAIPDFEGVLGLSLSAKPFEICLKKRQ